METEGWVRFSGYRSKAHYFVMELGKINYYRSLCHFSIFCHHTPFEQVSEKDKCKTCLKKLQSSSALEKKVKE